jgi:HEAT repeat protein
VIDEQKFLAGIRSENADERFLMWRQAGDAPPSVIPELGRLSGGDNPGVAHAAAEALTTMVHSVGKDPASPNRAAVVQGLLALAGGGPLPARVHALRLLSNIAGEDSARAIAAHLSSPDLREEAIFALERIPGDAPVEAIMGAYKSAPPEFKPRLLAALGHRRASQAVPLVAGEIASTDKTVVLAAMRAYARIGVKATPSPRLPAPDTFSGWQRTEHLDSVLRFADAMVAQRNTSDAMAIYRTALGMPEEHIQCAGIIGLSKIGTPEAADAIYPKLKSGNRKVRITAQQAWRRIAG